MKTQGVSMMKFRVTRWTAYGGENMYTVACYSEGVQVYRMTLQGTATTSDLLESARAMRGILRSAREHIKGG